MLRSWKLGSAFGIGVYVHWTFLLLPAFVFLSHRSDGQAQAILLSLLVFPIFGCVVLHEFGHALMARRFGIETRDITLYPIGGVARLERMSEKPLEELLIALAGPAVNVVIIIVLLATLLIFGFAFGAGSQSFPDSALVLVLMYLLVSNAVLVGLNMLPAFPMDGGRVFRALLAMRMGQLRATEIAARLGVGFSVAFFVLPVLWPQFGFPWLMVIGGFLLLVGPQELAAVRRREALRRAELMDVLPADDVLVQASGPASAGFSGFVWDTRANLWVEWRNGRPIGYVVFEAE